MSMTGRGPSRELEVEFKVEVVTTVRASAERAIPSARRDDIRRDASRKTSLQKATSSTGTQRVGVQLQGSPSTCEVLVDASIGPPPTPPRPRGNIAAEVTSFDLDACVT
ncbi:hypothetical protein HYQ46_006552 [Verticillium longisporum]|nr:hypothetical protein HYQ46_006552 [Verticillium longisporum]